MPKITPKVANNWFANKNLKPAFNHLDVYGQEHGTAFTVVKAMELDVRKNSSLSPYGYLPI